MQNLETFVAVLISVFVFGLSCGAYVVSLYNGRRAELRQRFMRERMGSLKETEFETEFRTWCSEHHPHQYNLFVR